MLLRSDEKRQVILYMFPGLYVFVATHINATEHRQRALLVVFDIGGTGFDLTVTGEEPKSFEAAVIGNDVIHEFQGGKGKHLFVMLDPDSVLAVELRRTVLQGRPLCGIRSKQRWAGAAEVAQAIENGAVCASVSAKVRRLLRELLGSEERAPRPDARLTSVAKAIKTAPRHEIALPTLANSVGLSEGYLSQLFKEQFGLPITSYVKWLRIVEAIAAIGRGDNFTQAAYEAGFADSAHFTRTYREMFGVTPSEIYVDSDLEIRLCVDQPAGAGVGTGSF